MKIKVIILASLMALGAIASNAGPTRTLTEIQMLVDEGGFKHYPGLVTQNHKPRYPYVLGANLSVGSVAPKVTNAADLLAAAKKKQVVKVSGPTTFCYPVYKEMAKQNGVSCDAMMDHLDLHWDGEFTPETGVMSVVQSIIPTIEVHVTAHVGTSTSSSKPVVVVPVAPAEDNNNYHNDDAVDAFQDNESKGVEAATEAFHEANAEKFDITVDEAQKNFLNDFIECGTDC